MNHKLSDWASVAEITSGIAVVITIVILIVGIKENTDVMKTSMYAQSLDALNQWRDTIVENREAAELWEAYRASEVDGLDDVDMSRLIQLVMTLFTIYDYSYFSWQRDLIGDTEWDRFKTQICIQYDRVVALPRLSRSYESLVTEEFREYVSELCLRGRFFESNGVQIHYTDQGEGEPVILMHGLNGNYEGTWFDSGIAQELLAAGYRVLALDARAHGLSGTPHDPGQYGREMALDVQRLMTDVGIEKAHIVGYSMGANIIGKLRAIQPDLFISLTLGGWGWREEDGPTPTQMALADSLEQGGGFMPLYREIYPDWTDEEREARSATSVANLADVQATVALLRGYYLGVSEQSIRANTIPTLAIIGEADPRKESVDALQGVMPNLDTVVIPGMDHAAARTHPMFLTSLIEFLERH